MSEQTFADELWLPRPRAEVFPFFADARNLEAITPAFLKFVVLTPAPIEMRAGALIDYKLRVHGIPLRWRTLISAWDAPRRFVDEQVRGPYRQWIHEHTFEERDGGTLMRDVVRYRVPGGALADRLFVRRDVERIFAFRREVLVRHFAA
jgi:ligand-binding SRPBCC domain-containing protein